MKTQRKSIKKNNKTHKNKSCLKIRDEYKNITAEVDLKALKSNLNYLRKKSGTDIMPVLKANAYGHDMIELAKYCRKIKVKYLGVATLGEALKIRESGDKGRILGWLYDVKNNNEIKDAVAKSIDIGIFDEKHIPIISKMLPKNAKAKIHLFVDTGIDRNGVPYENAFDAAVQISKDPKFELVGMMSHFCCSDKKNDSFTKEQLRLFRELRKRLESQNIKPELVHIGNTGGILNYDLSDFTLARSGSGIYGLVNDKNLTPVLSLKSKIIQLKYIHKGNAVGYNRKYIAHNKKYLAIIPVGYADFFPLTKSETMSVTINGSNRKILGVESMDQIVVEAKPNDKLGDNVLIFGNKKKGYKYTAVDYSNMSNTNIENIITHLSERIKYDFKE